MIFSLFKPAPNPAPKTSSDGPDTIAPPPRQPAYTPPPRTPGDSALTSPRTLSQLGYFFAGATFFALTAAFTRRRIAANQAGARLKFYSPSGSHTIADVAAREGVSAETIERAAEASTQKSTPGAFLAAEAFNLATINVVSFFCMMAGGLSFGLDISSLADLKEYARRHQTVSGQASGITDETSEKELEAFMVKLLEKKDELLGVKKEVSEPKTEGADGS